MRCVMSCYSSHQNLKFANLLTFLYEDFLSVWPAPSLPPAPREDKEYCLMSELNIRHRGGQSLSWQSAPPDRIKAGPAAARQTMDTLH